MGQQMRQPMKQSTTQQKKTVSSNETQNMIRGPKGNSMVNQGKVGMYLGDNSPIQEPMPVLNNFSTFA